MKDRPDTAVSRGRILVMDDEEIVRDVAQTILEELGYEVSLAADGAEAVEIYRKARGAGGGFDAVIVDLTIPGGLGGKEALRALIEIDPGVKAIVSSGHSKDPVMKDYRDFGFCAVIPKPYRVGELSKVVQEVVTGSAVRS